MLRSIFGLTAQILVVVGTSPTPMSSPPTTTVQAGPSGLNASYTPNSSRRSSPRSTMCTPNTSRRRSSPRSTSSRPNRRRTSLRNTTPTPTPGPSNDDNDGGNNLQRQYEILFNDQRNAAAGRRIAGIRTTNIITTT